MAPQTNQDTSEVIALLREAVTLSGLSQASFAKALGTSPARLSTYLSGQTRPSAYFLVRSLRLGRALGVAAAKGLMSAPGTAAAMRAYLTAGEEDWVWRMLLQGRDHLALMLSAESSVGDALASWEAEPGSTGDRDWDALLAAIVAHEFDEAGREAPAWARTFPPLEEPWIPEHPFLAPERVRAQTPEWLRERNIFVPAKDLVTA